VSIVSPLKHLLRYCARSPFALERLSVTRDASDRIARVRYVLARHKAANWVGPARGPPTDWDELVQAHDDRAFFQATDRQAARDRHSQPLSGAGCDPRMSGNCELGRGLRSREKNATEADAGRFEKPAPDAQAAPPEAQKSLISRKTVEEVPLTGLSFRHLTKTYTAVHTLEHVHR
jgi:hypothetical protein